MKTKNLRKIENGGKTNERDDSETTENDGRAIQEKGGKTNERDDSITTENDGRNDQKNGAKTNERNGGKTGGKTDGRLKMESNLFGENCIVCGSVPSFADDSTYVTYNKCRLTNQARIIRAMKCISEFLNSNKLVINQTKTTISEFMSKQKRPRIKTQQPTLTVTGAEGEIKEIKHDKFTRLLGINLQEDTSWRGHLELGEKPDNTRT